MLRRLTVAPLLAVLAILALGSATEARAQTEIPGNVTAVDGSTVTIQIPGDQLPREGDEVRLRFRDPVEGAGLVFLEGTWEVSAVRRDEVEATPRGETADPQTGLVAVISSENPQSKDDFEAEEAQQAQAAQQDEEPAVAAVVRDEDDSDVEQIERRRWVTVFAGGGAVSFQSPAFNGNDPKSEIRPRISASLGIFVLPNLAVSGYLGSVKVEADTGGQIEPSAQEIYKALGATLFFGTPGNVPGDVNPFIQAGPVWYDISYGGGGDPDVTGSGFFGGAGAVFTIRRGFGLYIAGHFLSSSFDSEDEDRYDPVFDRQPVEISAGASVIIG